MHERADEQAEGGDREGDGDDLEDDHSESTPRTSRPMSAKIAMVPATTTRSSMGSSGSWGDASAARP
ncbi:hypothetical protein [Agrococcus sp. ARC_14]|uniref:hypothetical protein n=1 Tax=Agrococcus sp. ARC_14 TaxID=2919927 RepID=UPI001F066320|nr:hypothetical protein [Agrococcus sp. ARC_14]MCH1881692.1 hypothetical protein [Agrococcus sp. ARC_14]